MKRGVLLEGGAAYCAFQAGVIQELDRLGVRFDHVTGVSAGALNGCAIVLRKASELFAMWSSIKNFRFINWRQLAWNRSPFDMSRLTNQLILAFFPPAELLRSPIEFCVTTTEIRSWQRHVHTNRTASDMLAVLRASNLVPIIHSRLITIQGTWHMDGGLSDNAPVDVPFAAGCDRVIAIVNNARGALYYNPITKRRRDVSIYRERLTIIHPPMPLPIRMSFDFDSDRMDATFAMGQAAAQQAVDRGAIAV